MPTRTNSAALRISSISSEHVHVTACRIGHRKGAADVADHEAGHHQPAPQRPGGTRHGLCPVTAASVSSSSIWQSSTEFSKWARTWDLRINRLPRILIFSGTYGKIGSASCCDFGPVRARGRRCSLILRNVNAVGCDRPAGLLAPVAPCRASGTRPWRSRRAAQGVLRLSLRDRSLASRLSAVGWPGEILLVRHRLHPLDRGTVERLLDREVCHGRGRRCTMPMLVIGWAPDDIARANLHDRFRLRVASSRTPR